MKCEKCGYDMNDNEKVCPFCNHVQPNSFENEVPNSQEKFIKCNLCGGKTPVEKEQCIHCGNMIHRPTVNNGLIKCSLCGGKTPINKEQCVHCGNMITRQNEETTIVTTNKVITNVQISEVEFKKDKKTAIIAIAAYYITFYIIGSILSSLIISIYSSAKGIDISNIGEDISIGEFLLLFYPSDYYTILAINNLCLYLALILCTVLICKKFLLRDYQSLKNDHSDFFKNVGTGVLIFYGATIGVSIIQNIIYSLFPIFEGANDLSSQNQATIEAVFSNGFFSTAVVVVMTVIFAPIVEELIFRKCFFNLFKNKGIATIIITGAIFGAIHVTEALLVELIATEVNTQNIAIELVSFLSYFGSGVAIGYIYTKSNYNVYVTMAVHAIANLISCIAMLSM